MKKDSKPFKWDEMAHREALNGGKPVSGELWAKMTDPFAQYFTPSDVSCRILPFELTDADFHELGAKPVWDDGNEGHYTAEDVVMVLKEMALMANNMIDQIEERERLMKEAMEKK